MRRTRAAAALAAAALILTPLAAQAGSAPAAPARAASFQPWLEEHLAGLADAARLRVAVRGTSLEAVTAATAAAGLVEEQRWPLVDAVVVWGTASQVRSLRDAEGVVHVDGDTPLAPNLQTSHQATRSDDALAALGDAGDVRGEGVSIAVIDSGVDGTHPMFAGPDGVSKVVRNVKNVCGAVLLAPSTSTRETCFQQMTTNDTDTISVGGHGTHVAGIAAGNQVITTAPAGTVLRGSATGAKLVGLSVGAAIGLLDAMSAQNWVLEHQRKPCAPATQQDGEIDPACPPIRVTNHSYGPATAPEGGFRFNPDSADVVLQRALVDKGVVAVWAAGNSGGDGSIAQTNPPGMDPTPGIVMVASYDDGQSGDRDNALSSFSSRGKAGDQITYPDLAAPGSAITAACRPTLVICQGSPSFDGGNYQTISGTSMAAPYVAGVVAQLFSADPDLTPGAAEQILVDTAHRFTAGGAYEADAQRGGQTSFDKGHGLVDVFAALGTVLGQDAPTAGAAAPPAPRCGDGTDLVTDPAGDTNAPGGTGAPAAAQDLVSLSFAAAGDVMTVTTTYANLSQVPAPGSTSTAHTATWVGPDDVRYGVSHVTPGGGYTVGRFDEGTNRLAAGTTTPVSGSFIQGVGGTVSWSVPFGLVGSPVVPASAEDAHDGNPAVREAVALTLAGVGALGTGLTFVAPVDRAPDGGATPAWSVCPQTAGDVTAPADPSDPADAGDPVGPRDRKAKKAKAPKGQPQRS